ncbi:MAG: transketolase [Ignavibacteria bacterium]|nr:transketolase [Ignavibacteria bacterium]
MSYEHCLRTIAEQDSSVIVMTAENRAAIRGLPPHLGNRFIDVGIAEQTMVGAAAGLALRGRKPVVHALSTFLTMRAFEFIRTDVGIANLPVKLVGGVPGFLSEANGPTHQAVEDISLMRGIPNMHVFCAADEQELVDAMPAIIASPAPWYIRYNASSPACEHREPFRIGQCEQIAVGTDVTILVYGFLLEQAVKAREILLPRGLSVGLVNMRTLAPVDAAALLKVARTSRLLVTVEDHFQTGGLYSILAELFLANRIAPAVLPIALKDRWFHPGLLADVLEIEGFTASQIAEQISTRLSSLH